MECLAVIPARGGSKGLPGKNIMLLKGKPLLAWSVEAARASRHITRTVVSTDLEEIAAVARQWGAEVPFLRPPELALDETPTVEVLLDLLARLRASEGYEPEVVVTLQPTSPLRTAGDIDGALEMLKERGAEAVVSLCRVRQYPHWMKTLDREGRMHPFLQSDLAASRRQALPELYIPNGAVYAALTRALLSRRTYYLEGALGYVMPEERSVDIDDRLDFDRAEFLLASGMKRSLT